MRIRVLGCYGGVTDHHSVAGFLVNETVLLEAGTVCDTLSVEQQHKIEAVFISHSHLDHCAGVAFLVDNLYGDVTEPLRIMAMPETVEAIQKNLFNGQVWPDFISITSTGNSVAVFETLELNAPKQVGELCFTPFRVDHVIPTVGFIISDGKSSVLYSSDTRDVLGIVEKAQEVENLKLAIVEASFPNELEEFAFKTGHLAPIALRPLVSALRGKVPVRLFHMKPRYVERIEEQVAELGGDVRLLRQEEVLEV